MAATTYQSDGQFAQQDPYAPAAKDSPMQGKPRRSDLVPEDEVVVLKEKVFIPLDKYPGYNFVGALIGPGGSILQGLTKSLRAKIGIFGKGSKKDKSKEEELLSSDEPEHQHLKEPLHVLIDIKAPRSEAHRRMADALIEIYAFMVPPNQQQNQHQFNDGYGGGGYGGGGYGGGGYGGGGFGGEYGGGYGGGPPRGRGGPPRGGRGRGRGQGRTAPY